MDDVDLGPTRGIRREERSTYAPSLAEIFNQSTEDARRVANWNAHRYNLSEVFDDVAERVKAATGETIDNPLRGWTLDPQAAWKESIGKLKAKKPDALDWDALAAEPEQRAWGMMKETRETSNDMGQVLGLADPKAGVLGGVPIMGSVAALARNVATQPGTVLAQMGGSLYGQLSSPADTLGNLIGFGAGRAATSIIKSAVMNAASNAAVQGVLSAGKQGDYAKAGLPSGWKVWLEEVEGAAAMGFALDAGIRTPARAAIRQFGRDVEAGKAFSRNTVRGGFLKDAEPPAPAPKIDPETLRKAADGDLLHHGDLAAAREVLEKTGALDDPAVKGAFDHLEGGGRLTEITLRELKEMGVERVYGLRMLADAVGGREALLPAPPAIATQPLMPEHGVQLLTELGARVESFPESIRRAVQDGLESGVPAVVNLVRAEMAAGADKVEKTVIGFKTAKGSSYVIQKDGTTIRDKKARAEHPGEQGIQPKADSVIYVTEKQADALSVVQAELYANQGQTRVLLEIAPLGDGRWGVRATTGPDAGKFYKDTVITPTATPAAGLLPVEIWDKYKPHFGNKIVEVTESAEGLAERLGKAITPTIAARARVQSGMASALEIADLIRRYPGMLDTNVALDTDRVRLARDIATLEDTAFEAVARQHVPPEIGALVAQRVPHAAQAQLIDDIAKLAPKTLADARDILDQIAPAPGPDHKPLVPHGSEGAGDMTPERMEALRGVAGQAYEDAKAPLARRAELESKIEDIKGKIASAQMKTEDGTDAPGRRNRTMSDEIKNIDDELARLQQELARITDEIEEHQYRADLREVIKAESTKEQRDSWMSVDADHIEDLMERQSDITNEINKLKSARNSASGARQSTDPETGEPLSPGEVESIVSQWSYVREMRAVKPPKSIVDFLRGLGGVVDETGDILHRMGDNKKRPGLRSRNGMAPNDATLRAWKAGYLGSGDRPGINALYDAIGEDLQGNRVYSDADADIVSDLALAREMEKDLELYGIANLKRERDVRAHFEGARDRGAARDTAVAGAKAIEKQRAELAAAERELAEINRQIAAEIKNAEPVSLRADLSMADRERQLADLTAACRE